MKANPAGILHEARFPLDHVLFLPLLYDRRYVSSFQFFRLL